MPRSPHTTLSTPGGRWSARISAMSKVVTGVVSEGLSTIVLPAAKRRRPLPHGHHHRVVPGRDRAAHADRLAPDVGGVTGQVLPRRPALQAAGRRWQRTGSGRASAGLPRPASSASGLPVFWLSAADEVLGACAEGVGSAQQGQAAFGGRGPLPLGEGGRPPHRPPDPRRACRRPAPWRTPRRCSGRRWRPVRPHGRPRARPRRNSKAPAVLLPIVDRPGCVRTSVPAPALRRRPSPP